MPVSPPPPPPAGDPPPASAPRTRGRPARPEAELARQIADAAQRIMLVRGYGAMTMEAVAKDAGVAKKTVYRFAPNREALLGLIVSNWTDSFLPAFTQDAETPDQVGPVLAGILSVIADRVLSAEAVGLFRLLVTDSPAREEFLAVYDRNGIERSRALLADWLARHRTRGVVSLDDPAVAADLILSMVIAEPLRKIAIGLTPPLTGGDLSPRIGAALRLIGL